MILERLLKHQLPSDSHMLLPALAWIVTFSPLLLGTVWEEYESSWVWRNMMRRIHAEIQGGASATGPALPKVFRGKCADSSLLRKIS